jgi:hypothetical protein
MRGRMWRAHFKAGNEVGWRFIAIRSDVASICGPGVSPECNIGIGTSVGPQMRQADTF